SFDIFAFMRRPVKKLALLATIVGLSLSFNTSAKEDQSSVIERIKPFGSVCVQGKPCAVKAPVVAAAPAEGAAPRTGEQVYTAVCAGCHGAGVMGAPKYGTADWAPRKAKGMATLHEHAIKGFNAMPAKGGCAACSDEEIKNAVDYMVK
ncbi:MAG: cytochrome c5 family protein, partial [Pseudomonadales bacterium]|nr:cytochrome c5 family protein [Pseudomonadales bacterium]